MTPFDLTLLLILSNSVQNAITGPYTSLVGGMVAATVLLVTNSLVPDLSGANRRFREFIQGQPSMLIDDGQVIESHMARERVSIAASDARTRDRGLSRGRDRVLEVEGFSSFLKYDDIHPTANPHLVPRKGGFRRGHNARMGVLMLTRQPPVPESGVPKKRA